MFLKIVLLFSCSAYLAHSQIFPQIQLPRIPHPRFSLSPSCDEAQCCDDSTISVTGEAALQVQPDQAIISAGVKASAKTVEQAVIALAGKTSSIIRILNSNGLTEDNYETSNFNVYANTSWNNGVSTLLGQIASQSFTVTLPAITPDGSSLGKLIDQLASVNGITLNGLSFDLANKTSVYSQAREEAFKQAVLKAKDYAEALSLQLGQAINVRDTFSSAPVVSQSGNSQLKLSLAADSAPTTVTVGTIPVDYSVEVVFQFA